MKQEVFSKEMLDACNAALDQGVFYQKDFSEFVLQRMGGLGCEPVRSGEIVDGGFREREAFAMRIAQMPRGSYGILRRSGTDDYPGSFAAAVSDGTGDVATGGRFDHFDKEPSGETVVRRMVEYEIYLCRNQLENERRVAKNQDALARCFVGQVIKGYRHPSEAKPYSRAEVTGVVPETGRVRLLLTKRGSKARWETSVGAEWFVQQMDAQPAETALF